MGGIIRIGVDDLNTQREMIDKAMAANSPAYVEDPDSVYAQYWNHADAIGRLLDEIAAALEDGSVVLVATDRTFNRSKE